jgi:RNA polymerase sigma-70 factor (ECF subfamily)
LDYSKLDDGTLLRLIKEGQPNALNELYDRYGRLVYSVSFQIVGEQAAAEDITLEVFTKAWQKAGTYRPDRGKVRAWLSGMTRNRSIDALRRDGVRLKIQRKIWAEAASSSTTIDRDLESMIDLGMRKESLKEAINQLTEEQRDLLALAYFQGYTQREIAQLRDLPLGTVKTRIRSAVQKLRKLLQEENV